MSAVTVNVRERIAYVAISHPPVNALARAVRAGLVEAFIAVGANPGVDGVVLLGIGKGFCAGGDLREFATPDAAAPPGLSADVHPAIEFCGKPVVAAIHGFALGGGLETALACHRRVATADARLGLPEARIGIIPLSATQRLPRLLGLAPAIEMILGGQSIEAARAPGLVDAIVGEEDLLRAAARLARIGDTPLVRNIAFPPDPAKVIDTARARIKAGAFPPFAHRLLDAMAAGLDAADFDEGLTRARAIYNAVLDSPESLAARRAFGSRRAATRDIP